MLTYPPFQPHFPRAQWTLPQVLEHQSRARPDAPFLSWTDAGLAQSFRQVNETVNSLAHGLAAVGIGHGDKVGILPVPFTPLTRPTKDSGAIPGFLVSCHTTIK